MIKYCFEDMDNKNAKVFISERGANPSKQKGNKKNSILF